MAPLMRIFSVFCVSVCRLCAALPVLRSVPVGQNATLPCNLTSSSQVTWFRLRADQLLPLLTVGHSPMKTHTVDGHAADMSRLGSEGNPGTGSVRLEVLEAEEGDVGLYFCVGRCAGAVCVDAGVRLTVTGADGASGRDAPRQPCWSLGICVLPGFLALCFVVVAGLYLCTGKPAACCCSWGRRGSAPRGAEDQSLTYSSLKHAQKPRPFAPGRKDDVTYSSVATRKNPDGSRDLRPR